MLYLAACQPFDYFLSPFSRHAFDTFSHYCRMPCHAIIIAAADFRHLLFDTPLLDYFRRCRDVISMSMLDG